MTSAPQIRLRTIFLLFFCATVGLTTSTKPNGALRTTVEITIVIGLWQQARQLLSWRTNECDSFAELSFARRFAIFWRIALAMILAACVLWRLLLAKQFVTSPERGELFSDPLDLGLPQLCVLIALCSSWTRWRSSRPVVSLRAVRLPLLWIFGIAIALIMLSDGNLVPFLVHRAMQGIERAQNPRFQRSDLYVQLSDEGYYAIWFGFAAVAWLFVAALVAIHLRDERAWPTVRRYRWPIFFVLLVPATAFCIWYHRYEFYRVSPDMGSVGFAMTRFDLLIGALLATVAVTAGAYKMAVRAAPMAIVYTDLSTELDRRAFHESFIVLLLLLAAAVSNICYRASEFFAYAPSLAAISFRLFLCFLCDPYSILAIATLVVTIQLCWVRWKTRSQQVPWMLPALSQRIFVEGWIMLALLLVAGIPTIQAFVFLLSTTPYHIPSHLGY
jgi:hypothetical protein